MNKKGFTLIELLAVILILGIIMLIAIPVINNSIREARRGAFKSTVYSIEKSASQACKMDQMQHYDGILSFDFNDGVYTKISGGPHDLDVKGDLPKSGTVDTNSNCSVRITDLCDSEYCANKEYDEVEVTIISSKDNASDRLAIISDQNEDGKSNVGDMIQIGKEKFSI